MEEEEGKGGRAEQSMLKEGGANTELVGFVPIQKLGGFARRFGKQSGLGGWGCHQFRGRKKKFNRSDIKTSKFSCPSHVE